MVERRDGKGNQRKDGEERDMVSFHETKSTTDPFIVWKETSESKGEVELLSSGRE